MLRQEAREGGSKLNFVGKILTVDDIVSAYEQALDGRRLEVRVPAADGVLARLLAFSPEQAIDCSPCCRSSGLAVGTTT